MNTNELASQFLSWAMGYRAHCMRAGASMVIYITLDSMSRAWYMRGEYCKQEGLACYFFLL